MNGVCYGQLSQGSPLTPRRQLYRWDYNTKYVVPQTFVTNMFTYFLKVN